MTIKEIKKNFLFSGHTCTCMYCAYIGSCDKILPGMIKQIECDGPFYKLDNTDYEEENNND